MATHLAVQRELVIGKKSIGFIKEEVSSDEFLEPPILSPGQSDTPSDSLHTRDREGSRSSNNTCTQLDTHLYTGHPHLYTGHPIHTSTLDIHMYTF